MSAKRAAFVTLGCKINQYETEAMREGVLRLGYEEAGPGVEAEVVVVNTCAVTRTAAAKSRRSILRAARCNPGARIIVVGCSSPEERDVIRALPRVVLAGGNEEKRRVAAFLAGQWSPEDLPGRPARPPGGPPGGTSRGSDRAEEDVGITRFGDRTRAVIKVQDGCNRFCSFCIIPHLRGLSRSRPLEVVAREVEAVVAAGYREIVVSGVHLQDWGLDLDPPARLSDLLARVAELPGLLRVRLSSLGPVAFTPDLLAVLQSPRFCRHWHIPIQAGSDAVLEKMRRGYTVGEYARVLERLRDRFEEPAITTDVLVGHPGETRADFEAGLELYRRLGFAKLHVFPFSSREGTLASRFRDVVAPGEVKRRARQCGELDRELAAAHRRSLLGREVEVLVEAGARAAAQSEMEGLSERYVRVRFAVPEGREPERLAGELARVRAVATSEGGVRGVWVSGGAGEEGAVAAAEGAQGRERDGG